MRVGLFSGGPNPECMSTATLRFCHLLLLYIALAVYRAIFRCRNGVNLAETVKWGRGGGGVPSSPKDTNFATDDCLETGTPPRRETLRNQLFVNHQDTDWALGEATRRRAALLLGKTAPGQLGSSLI